VTKLEKLIENKWGCGITKNLCRRTRCLGNRPLAAKVHLEMDVHSVLQKRQRHGQDDVKIKLGRHKK